MIECTTQQGKENVVDRWAKLPTSLTTLTLSLIECTTQQVKENRCPGPVSPTILPTSLTTLTLLMEWRRKIGKLRVILWVISTAKCPMMSTKNTMRMLRIIELAVPRDEYGKKFMGREQSLEVKEEFERKWVWICF